MQWTLEEEKYLRENYPSSSRSDILQTLKRNWGTIVFRAGKLGLKRRGIYSSGNLNKLLEDNSLSYYYIGLLMADGHFETKGSKKTIDLALNKNDKDYLQKYADFVEYKKEMSYRENCSSYRVIVSDQNLVSKITRKFNFNDRKTYMPPVLTWIKDISPDLYFSLWVGYIDGDGSIRYKKNRKKENRDSCSIRIQCHKSWVNNLIEFEEFLYSYFEIKRNNKKLPRINSRGESFFDISDMALVVKMKHKIIDLGIYDNVMHRKWGIIKLDYENPQFKLADERMQEIRALISEGKTAVDISEEIGCTPEHIYGIIRKENLYGMGTGISSAKRKFWGDDEIELLKEKFPITKGKDICEYFPNRSFGTIKGKAESMRLRKENKKC